MSVDLLALNFDNLEESEAMNNWDIYGFSSKDVSTGDMVKILNITVHGDSALLHLENSLNITISLKKEKKFFEKLNIGIKTYEQLIEWFNNTDIKQYLLENEMHVYINVINQNITGSLIQAYIFNRRIEFFKEIKLNSKHYVAKVLDKNNGGFLVDVDGVPAFLPGSLASANKIVNFDKLIGKEVNVMFEDYLTNLDTFIVSNKKYIQYVLPIKLENLKVGNWYKGKITGTIEFGIFVEFEDIMTGLLHYSEMNDEIIERFKNKGYRAGDTIDFLIKEITKDNKIILSTKEKTSLVSITEFKEENEGKVIDGTITAIKYNIGSFVEFKYKDTSFTGLLHVKFNTNQDKFKIGDNMPFLIAKVDDKTNKIFLRLPKK